MEQPEWKPDFKSLDAILEEQLSDLALFQRERPLRTGFDLLDKLLEGGITPGLIVLGAGPSQGKSTLALQLAEYVSGKEQVPVLYFSLEMARERIAAKLVTLENFRSAKREGFPVDDFPDGNAAKQKFFTAADLFNYYALESMPEEKRRQLEGARERVRENKNLHIIDRPYCAREIVEVVNKFLENSQGETRKPLVIVDYLQILPPDPQIRGLVTDKQQVDHNLKVLRELVLKEIPVILISSLNRASYGAGTTSMQASNFKETGNIEYSSDVLMGLQFSACHQENGCDPIEEKRRYPRNMEIIILKQRYGSGDSIVPLRYYAEFDYMEEKGPEGAEENTKDTGAKIKPPKSTSKPKSSKKEADGEGSEEQAKPAEIQKQEPAPQAETIEPQQEPQPLQATDAEEENAQAVSAETAKTGKQENNSKVQYMNNTKISYEIRNKNWESGKTARCKVGTYKKESVITTFQLTGEIKCFDCDVADVLYSLYRGGNRKFTIRQVMEALSGDEKQTLTEQRWRAIKESLDRLMKAEIIIDCTQEMVKMRKKPEMLEDDKVVIRGKFLAAMRLEEDRPKGKWPNFQYAFQDRNAVGGACPMPLYHYGELTRQLITFPEHLLSVRLPGGRKLSDTEENVMIKRYLIRRLEVIRKGKGSTSHLRKIGYYSSNIAGDSGMLATIGVSRANYEPTAWQNKLAKTHKTVTGILDSYAEHQYIGPYQQKKPEWVELIGKVKDPYNLKWE